MRDIAISIVIFGLLPLALMRPYVGALMWAWVSIMNPHRLAFGFAHFFPFAAIIAGVTLVGAAISRDRKPFPWTSITALHVMFMIWMTITSVFAMAEPSVTYELWLRVFKIHLMLFVTLMLLRGREHIDLMVWVLVGSVAFYGVKGGIWTVLTGGGQRVYGPPGGVIENNNELALALIMIVPLMYYLMTTTKRTLVKYGLIFGMIACGFAILGSHSRGAFLAIIAASGMLALKSRHPIVLSILGTAGLLGMFAFMPEHWTSRMHSLESSADQLDWSAASRLRTWETLWKMALDNPIVGAGFETALPEIFIRYAPEPSMLAYSPHSIYFQALAEHGFVGLGLFLMLVWVTWRRATRIAKICRATPGFEWGDPLMRMIQVSIIGYMVGGAFLNLLHFDLTYYLFGLVVLVEATLREQSSAFAARSAVPSRSPPRNVTGQSPVIRG